MTSRHVDSDDVLSAAGKLLGQALTTSSRHLAFGIARVRFNQEVAYFAKRITEDVAAGCLTPNQGLQALMQEQTHLLMQSTTLARTRSGAITDEAKSRALLMLKTCAAQSDPQRLLRAVQAQNLNVSNLKSTNSVQVAAQAPINDLKFFPSERWPAEVPAPEEPGFYIVPKSIAVEKLQTQLFPSPNSSVIARFKALNPNLELVKAGSMIVLSDPDNQQCTYEESLLMETAQIVSAVLEPLTVEEADFMALHYGVIQNALSYQSKVIGITTAMVANHLDGIKNILEDIETLHTNTLKTNGSLNSKNFKKQRTHLLKKLDLQLTRLSKKTLGLPDHPNLKKALGIGHPYLVHRWRKAGGIGQNPGYATHIRAVTQASQYVKYGGWIGTALGGSASAMKVQDVCRHGSTEACEKVKFTETGSFWGGVGGGALASGIFTASATTAICVGIGVPTGGVGTLLCGVFVAGAGSLAGGYVGEKTGEHLADLIHESKK